MRSLRIRRPSMRFTWQSSSAACSWRAVVSSPPSGSKTRSGVSRRQTVREDSSPVSHDQRPWHRHRHCSRKERLMDDGQIHKMIEDLVAEEHRLWDDEAEGGNAEADKQRLAEVKVALDKCWDLLRQRRAFAQQSLDP